MKKYVYKPYSKFLIQLFNKEKGMLRNFLEDDVLIEHVGSTSIPNMGGKGIIDIVIAVPSQENLSKTSSKLIEAGYYYNPEDGTDERWFHGRKVSDSERYHAHLTFKGSKDWKEITSFRDYLIFHPKEAKRYIQLKKDAVREAKEDGEKYKKIKEPFIKEIIEKAK